MAHKKDHLRWRKSLINVKRNSTFSSNESQSANKKWHFWSRASGYSSDFSLRFLHFPAEITPSSPSARWVLCSGSRNRLTRLRTSGIIRRDQPDINHPTLAHARVITFYTTLHAKQAAVTTCRKAQRREAERERGELKGQEYYPSECKRDYEDKLDYDCKKIRKKGGKRTVTVFPHNLYPSTQMQFSSEQHTAAQEHFISLEAWKM